MVATLLLTARLSLPDIPWLVFPYQPRSFVFPLYFNPRVGQLEALSSAGLHPAQTGNAREILRNFSTYLWSPDEVQMMRTVGNTRGKETELFGGCWEGCACNFAPG